MSILIKGMEMPEYGCSTCPMCDEAEKENWWIKYKCVLLNKLVVTSTCKRDSNCPLVELPPHGRLIDADAYPDKLLKLMQSPSSLVNAPWIINTLREMPTIIEAETCNNSQETCNKTCNKLQNASKWVLKTFDDGYGEYQLYVCDKCGERVVHRTSYCPNCGARMVEE